jgi:aminoglycoside/choline kinase family phosphotransferase
MTMTNEQLAEQTERDRRIDGYLAASGLAPRVSRVEPLAGDASDRRYFRVLLDDGATVVLALHASPFDIASLPFANVAGLLEQMNFPVPAILGHADRDGVLALQDLGDVTLQTHLGVASPSERARLYRDAVSLLGVLQRRGAELASERYLPYGLAFDVEKLTWELEFFVQQFLEGHRGVVLATAEREPLREEWSSIAGELAAEPRVVCHRDYHSRNLMLRDGRLYVIDFQDARLGPDTYDLVSLLRDSYVSLPDHEVDDHMGHFLAVTRRTPDALPEFRRRFDLMSIQRNLKALGTFGYQTTTRRNPVYVQHMPRTLGYIKTNLERYDRFSRLRALLSSHLEELR